MQRYESISTAQLPDPDARMALLMNPSRATCIELQGVLDRRKFLLTTAAGIAALGTGSSVQAAEPVQRNGKPHFKLSLAAYSFRNLLTRGWPSPSGKKGELTLFDFIDFCAEQNLDGTELTSYYFPNPLPHEYLMEVKERAFRLGLGISGTAIGNDFCHPDGPKRDEQLKLCHDWIDFAAEMDAPVIRIFAGNVKKGQTEEEAVAQCVHAINHSLVHAAKRGVVLALENHGGITSTPEQLLNIVKQVTPSPWFGVNFDSGNFRTADPYGDLEKIAPYAVNAQVKAKMAPAGKSAEEADYKRIVQILKDAGYRGYLVLEFEEKGDPRELVPDHLNQLRELIS